MGDRPFNILFLCTHNSARSIIAECTLNRIGAGKFRGYSAGSQPKGEVHPLALALLRRLNYGTDGLRSKSWREFTTPEAPKLDFVFTVSLPGVAGSAHVGALGCARPLACHRERG